MKDIQRATQALRAIGEVYVLALPDLDVPELDYFIARMQDDRRKMVERREAESASGISITLAAPVGEAAATNPLARRAVKDMRAAAEGEERNRMHDEAEAK